MVGTGMWGHSRRKGELYGLVLIHKWKYLHTQLAVMLSIPEQVCHQEVIGLWTGEINLLFFCAALLRTRRGCGIGRMRCGIGR